MFKKCAALPPAAPGGCNLSEFFSGIRAAAEALTVNASFGGGSLWKLKRTVLT